MELARLTGGWTERRGGGGARRDEALSVLSAAVEPASRQRDDVPTNERTNSDTVQSFLNAPNTRDGVRDKAKRGTRRMGPDRAALCIGGPPRLQHSTDWPHEAARGRTRFPRADRAPLCTRSHCEQAVPARPRSLVPLRPRQSVQPPLPYIVRRGRLEGGSTPDDTAAACSLHAQPRQAHLTTTDSLVIPSPLPTS